MTRISLQMPETLPELRKRFRGQVGIHTLLPPQGIAGKLSVIVSGIDRQAIRQRPETAQRGKHRLRSAESATADKQGISGKQRGIIRGSVADGIRRMSRRKKTFQKSLPERETLSIVQFPVAAQRRETRGADRRREKTPDKRNTRNMIGMRMRQKDVSAFQAGNCTLCRIPCRMNFLHITAGIHNRTIRPVPDKIRKVGIESGNPDLLCLKHDKTPFGKKNKGKNGKINKNSEKKLCFF